jgi:type IX secretion system PorP/SprF family membrane protein
MVVSDQAGDGIYQNNSASGVYNYRLEASSSIVINAGFQATYQQMSIDWNRLVFADQLLNGGGTSEIQPGLNKSLVDFSAGILAGYRESAYIGFAAHHLTQPDNGFFPNSGSKQLMKMTVHAGALFNLESGGLFDGDEQSLSLSPNLLYMKQGDFQQLNAGVYLNMYPFVGGLWFRYNFDNADAAIALLGFQFNQFKIGYTYDYTVSKLTNATGGAHEVSVAWQFGCPEKREKIKAIKCPSF